MPTSGSPLNCATAFGRRWQASRPSIPWRASRGVSATSFATPAGTLIGSPGSTPGQGGLRCRPGPREAAEPRGAAGQAAAGRPAALHLSRPAPLPREIGPLCPGLGRAARCARQAWQPVGRGRARAWLLPAHVPAARRLPRWPPGAAAGPAIGPLHLRQVCRPVDQDADVSAARRPSSVTIAAAAASRSIAPMSLSAAPSGGLKARRREASLQVCQRSAVAERRAG